MGYRYLETDVHATADGVLLAFHDLRLDRVTDGTGAIADAAVCRGASRADQRHRADPAAVRPARGVPRRPHQHRRQGAAARSSPLAEVVRAHGAIDRVCVGSFSRPAAPGRPRGSSGPRLATAAGPVGGRGRCAWPRDADRRLAALPRRRCCRSRPAHVVGGRRLDLVTPALVERVHALGKHVHVWTIDDAAEMHRLFDLGVDGIVVRPHRHPRRRAGRTRRTVEPVTAPDPAPAPDRVARDGDARQHRSTGRVGVFHPATPLLSVSLLALITVIAFEGMAVSTAMPDAARELDAVRSYGLAFSVMLTTQLLGIVLAGVWCDRSGPLPSLFAGQLLFAAGCGHVRRRRRPSGRSSPGAGVAGLGAGLIIVAVYVVIGRAYPESLRPKVFSVISAAWVLPSLLGPPIAAWVTTTWSWRWVFWLVVLPVVVAIVAGARPRARQIASADDGHRRSPAATTAQHARAAWFGVLIAASAGALQWGTHDLEFSWSAKTAVAVVGRRSGIAVTAPLLLPRGHLADAPRPAVGDAGAVPADLLVLRHDHLRPADARQRARPVAWRGRARSSPSARSAGRPARGSRAATGGPGAATGSSAPAGVLLTARPAGRRRGHALRLAPLAGRAWPSSPAASAWAWAPRACRSCR